MDKIKEDNGLRTQHSPGTKQSMIMYKSGIHQLTFSKSQATLGLGIKKDPMTKSIIKKDPV